MAKGGTKIYCPQCKDFSPCKAISPTALGKPSHRRWKRTDFGDVAWFRRCRRCLSCGHEFLTAEVEETLISELVALRERLAQKQKSQVTSIRRKRPWLKRKDTTPLELAERFLAATAWWLTHSSGSPVRAPGHADRIYESHRGWAVDFGANTFLVGKAIERCKNTINSFLDRAATGQIPTTSEVTATLKRQVSGAVANVEGYEYSGYYPVSNQDLVFGAQSINVSDAARFMIRESGIGDILLDA